MSQFVAEFEFLLQRGTMFKVLNVNKRYSDFYEVHLQVVGCKPVMPSQPPKEESITKSLRFRRSKSDNHFVAKLSDFIITTT